MTCQACLVAALNARSRSGRAIKAAEPPLAIAIQELEEARKQHTNAKRRTVSSIAPANDWFRRRPALDATDAEIAEWFRGKPLYGDPTHWFAGRLPSYANDVEIATWFREQRVTAADQTVTSLKKKLKRAKKDAQELQRRDDFSEAERSRSQTVSSSRHENRPNGKSRKSSGNWQGEPTSQKPRAAAMRGLPLSELVALREHNRPWLETAEYNTLSQTIQQKTM